MIVKMASVRSEDGYCSLIFGDLSQPPVRDGRTSILRSAKINRYVMQQLTVGRDNKSIAPNPTVRDGGNKRFWTAAGLVHQELSSDPAVDCLRKLVQNLVQAASTSRIFADTSLPVLEIHSVVELQIFAGGYNLSRSIRNKYGIV